MSYKFKLLQDANHRSSSTVYLKSLLSKKNLRKFEMLSRKMEVIGNDLKSQGYFQAIGISVFEKIVFPKGHSDQCYPTIIFKSTFICFKSIEY